MSRRGESVGSSSQGINMGQSVIADRGVHRTTCGYCNSSSSTRISHGLFADRVSVDDYQDLLDRGWRRSGNFLYKPEMERTCCPPYTIRLKVDAFVPTKEQKRVQRRIQRYIDGTNHGLRTVEYRQKENNIKCRKSSSSIPSIFETAEMPQVSASSKVSANTVNSKTPEVDSTAKSISSKIDVALKACVESGELPADTKFPLTTVKRLTAGMKKKLKGVARDVEYTSSISFQIAASLRRELVPENINNAFDVSLDVKGHKEKSEQLSPMVIAEKLASKLETSGLSGFLVQACNGHLNFLGHLNFIEDSMQSFHCENFPVMECVLPSPRKIGGNCKRDKDFDDNRSSQHHDKHKLEIRMKRSTFDPEEFALYKKYQIRVHNDRPEEVRESSYKRFLVETPLIFVPPGNDNSAPPCGFGSFHQQYLIDGRLVAVGVVDILPRCLSSKYMFWDPDLAFLSLGKYSALEEIKWVQAAQKHCPTLQYYYLGYYIHSCPKMRYKAAYHPSELLCAVHYQWTPFKLAKLVLDKAAYLCLCDVCDHAEPILSPATDDMHDSCGQDDHEMEDNLEFHGELHEFQSSGSSDHSMGVENGIEAPTVAFDTEDIGGVLIQWNDLQFRFKDLKASGIWGRRSIDLLTGHLQEYIKVVGTELSERIAYCLD
eukprot:PITA_00475